MFFMQDMQNYIFRSSAMQRLRYRPLDKWNLTMVNLAETSNSAYLDEEPMSVK
jgi:hypothetical protein